VEGEFSQRDIFWYSMTMLGIVLIPILLVVLVGFICAGLGR
jgi:hypothetical protein